MSAVLFYRVYLLICCHYTGPAESLGRTEAPPAYGDLFPGVKDVKSQVDKARQGEGMAPAPVAVPLTLCNILCKSCEFEDFIIIYTLIACHVEPNISLY